MTAGWVCYFLVSAEICEAFWTGLARFDFGISEYNSEENSLPAVLVAEDIGLCLLVSLGTDTRAFKEPF